MSPARRLAWLPLALVAGTLCACGASHAPAGPAPLAPDDAWVVRVARQQQTGLALARSAAADAHGGSVRRLARRIEARRRQLLPALMQRLAQVPSQRSLPDLGVSRTQAAEEIGPDALAGARPVDVAFLTIMSRSDQGALALARAELRRGRDPATKAMAQRVAAETAGELASLSRAMLAMAHRG